MVSSSVATAAATTPATTPVTPAPTPPAEPTFSKQIPIVCPGHTRPLAELQYVAVQVPTTITPEDQLATLTVTDAPVVTPTSETNTEILLVSACHDKQPMLRQGLTGNWLGTWTGHKGAVWSCQMDPTGNLTATASGDYSCRLWDAVTGTCLLDLPHKGVMKTVAFAPSSTKLATGGIGKAPSIRIYDLEQLLLEPKNGNKTPIVEIPQVAPISKVVWLDETSVVCGCYNGKIYIWNTDTSTLMQTFATTGADEIRDMELTRLTLTGKIILSVAAGQTVYFYDMSVHKLVQAHTLPQINFQNEGGLTLHPSGTKFVCGGGGLWVHVIDFVTGAQLECHKGHHGPIRCVRYAPHGTTFASGSEDGTIRLWQTETERNERI